MSKMDLYFLGRTIWDIWHDMSAIVFYTHVQLSDFFTCKGVKNGNFFIEVFNSWISPSKKSMQKCALQIIMVLQYFINEQTYVYWQVLKHTLSYKVLVPCLLQCLYDLFLALRYLKTCNDWIIIKMLTHWHDVSFHIFRLFHDRVLNKYTWWEIV